jgi:hypothetical protein
MTLEKPKPIEIDVWEDCEVEIKKYDAEYLKKHKNLEDGYLEVHEHRGGTGFFFSSMEVKDLFRNEKWHEILPTLHPLHLAFHGCHMPLQIDVFYKGDWHTIWRSGNDYESFAEEKKRKDGYVKFIEDEGKKIAKLIDKGKTFGQIEKALSDQHSGNTHSWAYNYGIVHAKDKEKAQKIKQDYNISCGGTGDEKGTINSAILTLRAKK